MKELQKLYKAQVEQQAVALGRVKVMELAALCIYVCVLLYFCVQVMEDELAALAELRMKEESATELSVGLFDTKRNIRVQKGRETQEKERREREKSEVESSFWPVANVQEYL